jgi:hypothetical protein|tara:strand:+ start:2239 stop:2520 length:282 start_codon:yes stop_codon:yes gene_type:complete
MGRGKVTRRIVVEYTQKLTRDKIRGERRLVPELDRIISWRKEPDGRLVWKEVKCPQNSWYGIKGYYGTLGLPVLFYNKDKNRWHKNLPETMNL